MIDVFDYIAFAAFGVIIVAAVVVIVTIGQIPGRVARFRGHPQAAAISAAGWLGVATGGVLWPIALIWAFLKPISLVSKPEEPKS
jgi:hypothetical protein